jgi:histidinol phosphatase-like PHP family hydrolase
MAKGSASSKLRRRQKSGFVDNGMISEWLAREAITCSGHWAHALKKASRKALLWPMEAATMVASGRALTELDGVGPRIAKLVSEWLKSPPATMEVEEKRLEFLTMAQALSVLTAHPEWAAQLKGDLQMHTRWSDGESEISTMAAAAVAKGHEYIAITDHTKGLKIAGGIDEKQLAEQGREIDTLNSTLKKTGTNFTILKSAEANLSTTGEVDMTRSALRKLDVVLCAFHSSLRTTDDQTERYLAAIRNPSLNILGHPQTRIYNHRKGLTADWHRVFAEAARLDKAVEIDGYADRQDLRISLLKIARLEGPRISMGTDSHHPWQLEFIDFSLAAACLAKIPPERILNFMPVEDLKAWARSSRS